MFACRRVLLSGFCVAFALTFVTSRNGFCQQEPIVAAHSSDDSFAGTDMGAIAPSLVLSDLRLVLKRSSEQQQALEMLLVRQQQPGDPLYHAWLTPAEFGETFGLPEGDLATIREWLVAQGFNVGPEDNGALVIDFSGSVGQVEKAFQVEIHRYREKDGTVHIAALGQQKVPQPLGKTVLGFTGLNGRAPSVDCNAVPEPVKQALELNMQQSNAAQGYEGANPCADAAKPAVHPNATSFTFSLLDSFTGTGGAAIGANPYYANLIQANDGNFYGTTGAGGGKNDGAVFKITPTGIYTLLHTFTDATTDGAYPEAGLVQGTDGNFYGTTYQGGASNNGTVFKITSTGTLTLLHSFTAMGTDGANPYAGLVQGTDGNFYGTASQGGANSSGMVFKITPTGTFTSLYSFTYGNDGANPYAGLVQGTDGNFYGTASQGGANSFGVVFNITSTGTFTSLYSFTDGNDGANPYAGLVQGTDGNFYGTSQGNANGFGEVFKITSTGTFTALYSFLTFANPDAALVQGTDGNFYGTSNQGGATNGGTVFNINSMGTFTLLHSFGGGTVDGQYPYGGLVQGTDGNFYGMTYQGGTSSNGTIYKLTAAPTEAAPVTLSASSTTLGLGQSFTMSYAVLNAYTGTVAGTLNQCFESNTGTDTTWKSVVDATSTTATKTVTPNALGTFTYALTCGGTESSTVSITVAKQTPTLTMTTPTAAAPVTQNDGALAAFSVTSTLTWTGTPAPTTARVVFTSTAAGTFGATTCGATSPATCTATFTPTSTDAAGSYSFSVSFIGDTNYNSTTASTISNDYVIIVPVAPTVTVSAVTAPYGSTTAVTVTATESGAYAASGSVVTFGTAGSVGGSFSPTTCTIVSGTCTTTYLPSGTLAVGTYANDITASFTASGPYTAASTASTLTIAENFAFSLLDSFTGASGAAIGANPFYANLIQANDGNFYGTTGAGGANSVGAVFKITATGTYTLLHSFSGGAADGQTPNAGLVQGTDGNFYGTTFGGGVNNLGVVFKITATGTFTLLHSFGGGTVDGQYPYGGLVQGTDGNFYGTTSNGGANSYGVVFKITATGTFTLLHSFSGGPADGEYAFAGLVQGTDGNFYGTTGVGGANGYGVVFKITPGGTFTLLHSFTDSNTDGAEPYAGLVQGTDGNFYGTTFQGGVNNLGVVFKITATGTFTLLHSFTGGTTDGQYPHAGLVQGTDGNFYGTAEQGGANNLGAVFKITATGTFTLLHSFTGGTTDGQSPYGGLVQGTDGNFYGMTNQGGAKSDGAIYKLTGSPTEAAPVTLSASATTLSLGQSFTMSYAVLNAYSTTTYGSQNQCFESNTGTDTTWNSVVDATSTTATATVTPNAAGTFTYALTCGGTESSTVSITVAKQTPTLTMTAPTAAAPVTQVQSSLAAFPVTSTLTWTGTTVPTASDVVFTSTAAGTFSATTCGATSPATCTATFTPTATDAAGSYSFSVSFIGDTNYSSTTASTISNDYVIIVPVAPTVTVSGVTAQFGSTTAVTVTATESGAYAASGSVVTFGTAGSVGGSFSPTTCTIVSGTCTTTYLPSGTLAVGTYANDITASFTASGPYTAASTASTLTIAENFAFSLLDSFTGASGAAIGANPYHANLIQANDGNFYGTTGVGGANSVGAVFKITPGGTYTLLHSFSAGAADGEVPNAGLVQGTDGNFYGTTHQGGANNLGVVFKITATGTFTLLHSFSGGPADGEYAFAGLVQGTDGSFYGTTSNGGANGYGVVFKITPGGTFTLLHSFTDSNTDGAEPYAGLVQGTDGNFYGTTFQGGVNNLGVVFKITSAGTFTLLHSFSGTADGEYPYAGLVQGTDGSFYGTTEYGGANNLGVVFKITPGGTYTLLHSFSGTADGEYPFAGLVQGTDGNFYGTTFEGGVNSLGVVFKITATGTFTLLHSFTGGTTDGQSPYGGLVQGTDGNFYGMTYQGGTSSNGTIYKLTASPAEAAPVTLSASATTLGLSQSFTMSYAVLNADTGTVAGTLNQCFESNTGTDTTWNSVVDATSTTATATVTPNALGTFTYALTCGGTESSTVSITVNKLTPALVMATPTSSAPVTQNDGALAAFSVTSTLTWTGAGAAPTAADVVFTSTAAGTFGATACGATSPATCTATFTPTTTDVAGSYSFSVSFTGDGNYNATTASTIANDYVIAKTTPTLSMYLPSASHPTTQAFGALAAFTVDSQFTGSGTVKATQADVVFSSTAAGTFGTTVCNATAFPELCHAVFTPTASDAIGSYSFSVLYLGDANYNPTALSTITNDYVITEQTPTLVMATPTTAAPVTQSEYFLAAFNVTATLTWNGTTSPTVGDIAFTSTAAGTFGAIACGGTSPATCTATFTPTSTDIPGSYNFSVVFTGDSSFSATATSTISNDYVINPTGALSSVTAPFGSVAGITVTATESGTAGTANGSVVTFGTAGSVGGSFSPPTCTIASGSCTTTYLPSGTLPPGTYANDLTASFSASGAYPATFAASGLTITQVWNFSLVASNTGTTGMAPGNGPASNLIQGNDGNFYGTTQTGGVNNLGTVFQVTPGGAYTVLHSFSGADGEDPVAPLVQGTDGNFYGSAYLGGTNNFGTLFKISSTGAFTLLHTFAGGAADGEYPNGLIQGTDGNFYGTSKQGDTYSVYSGGAGTVFVITPAGSFSLVYSFQGATIDGLFPLDSLVQGTDGSFYGTAEDGGAQGLGSVYKVTSADAFTLLQSLGAYNLGKTYGDYPVAPLVQGTDGNFYGTASNGGPNGTGTVFKVSPTFPYQLTLLYAFSASGTTDGGYPAAGLVLGTDGNLYGTSQSGGANGYGTIFQIQMTSPYTFTLLHSFSEALTDGEYPAGGLVQGADGNLYGTAEYGGANGDGAIFKLTAASPVRAPVGLSASSNTLMFGQSFTMSYAVLNADTGTVAGTLNQCFESNTGTDTTWNSVVDATSTTATKTVTPNALGTFTYALTCGGMESSLVTITVTPATASLTLSAATPGSSTAGVASTQLTATMTPATSGVTVMFTDSTTGATTTGVTNASGVATTTVTGTTAGPNSYTATITAAGNYTAATSNPVTVYYAGIELSSDLSHDFSIYPGTYDGSPVCNGSDGTNGSTCTAGYGIVVTNFTSATQVITVALNNAGSPNKAFSSATNCPVGGLAAGKTCNIVFYYLPPYGDGCSLSTTCTTPVGQPGPEGTYESAIWSLTASGTTLFGVAAGGAVAFPSLLDGKALLAAGNALSVTPSSLTFGPQAPGAVSATQNVTITNTSPASTGITYTLPGGKFTTTNNCAATLASQASCTIGISYSDASVANDSGSLVITPASGTAITVALTGSTVANTGLSLSSTAHNFGNVTEGTTATFGLSITNNAATSATLSFSNTAGTGFTVASSCGATLAAGASCNYNFTFAPTTTAAVTDSLIITSSLPILPGGSTSSPYTDTVTVTGTGVAGGSFTATSTGHNFGTVKVGSAATVYGTELTNSTAYPLTLTLGGGTFASSGAADGYTVVTNCGATLAINASCEVEFSFTPTAAGTTSVLYPVSAVGGSNGTTAVPFTSGGTTFTGITLTGTGD